MDPCESLLGTLPSSNQVSTKVVQGCADCRILRLDGQQLSLRLPRWFDEVGDRYVNDNSRIVSDPMMDAHDRRRIHECRRHFNDISHRGFRCRKFCTQLNSLLLVDMAKT